MMFSHGFPSVVHTSTSLLPMELPPRYFPRFPVRPACRCFHLVPSQPISHGFLSIHGGHASVSLPRNGALLKASSHCFPSVRPVVASISLPPSSPRATLSHPSTVSTLSPRPLPTDLSPSYFPPFPVSQRSSPQAISHGFPCVHAVVASISLPPTGPLPKLFPTFSHPSTMSTLSSRSLPMDLSQSYFPRFPIRPPCPRFHLAPKLYFPPFPVRPPCPRFRLAPSQRSSPQAISHGFPSVHSVVASISLHQAVSHGSVRPPCRRFRIAPRGKVN